MQFIDRIVGDFRYLKGALRTLKYITPIAQHRGRVFPHLIDELAEKYRTRRRSCPTASASPTASSPSAPTGIRAGRWRRGSTRATWSAC